MPTTWADASLLQQLTGYRPGTLLREGIREFVQWYCDYYKIKLTGPRKSPAKSATRRKPAQVSMTLRH